LLKPCELTVYCGNAAKTLGFALTLMLNVFRDNCDVDYVILMSLVSNTVAMFHVLNRVFHVVCWHPGNGDFLGFPRLSNVI